MDSLTQILLGGSVAAAAVPAAHRRKALVAGAVLGTLPDLDGIPLALMGADVVTAVTWHRGPSHALLLLAILSLLVWWLLRRVWRPVQEAPRPWLLAIALALITHPVLDAFTVYGTQLWWPASPPPAMWSSLFIIDPGYTLPLLVGFVSAAIAGPRRMGKTLLWLGLALSTAYLLWSLWAKTLVDRDTEAALAARGLQGAPYVSVPLPLNTLVWRVVVMTPDGYLEGERSLLVDERPLQFKAYPSETAALKAMSATPAVERLLWFTHGFMKAEAQGDSLVLSDLRMGAEPDYHFRYRIAQRDAQGQWQPVPVTAVSSPRNAGHQLSHMWQRLWQEPAALP